MFLAGAFSYLCKEAHNAGESAKASSYGAAAASMIFIFTSAFGATWLTVPWLYPAEIFPLAVRAKGNAWGVVGWSVGNGWLVSNPRLDPMELPRQGTLTSCFFNLDSTLSRNVLLHW